MIESQCCGNCLHWFPNSGNEQKPKEKHAGQCRYCPPQLITFQEMGEQPTGIVSKDGVPQMVGRPITQARSMFPPMLAIDPGCGKYCVDSEKGAAEAFPTFGGIKSD